MKPAKFSPLRARDRKRLVLIMLMLFSLLALLIVQFYRVQILEGELWSKIAHRQHFFIVKEPAHRGTFYSNTAIKKGQPETPQKLVVDIQRFHLYIDPQSIPEKNRDEMANVLKDLLKIADSKQAALRSHFNRKSRSRKLAMWLDSETRKTIMQWWEPYARKRKIVRNALYFVSDYQRSYPFGKLLGQVLHTVHNQKDEATHEIRPTGGLELYFDGYLTGKEGKRLLMRSPRNEFEQGEILAPPEDGADIYLTINHCLQAIVEEELARGVKKAKAKSGWAVMMDPHSGEILALAQYPFFHPADYQSYFNDPAQIEHTRIKAVTDANEPGSVIKPLTVCAALLANQELERRNLPPLFDPAEKMACSDASFPGRSRPLPDTHLHPFLDLNMAIQKSSNIYPARLAEKMVARLGSDWYRQTLAEVFGLGAKTGIELPSETRGVLPTVGKKHPNGTLEWSAATPYSLAIGYNLQTNSIQLARAYAILANGGYAVKPTLIRKIVKKGPQNQEIVLVDNTQPEQRATFSKLLGGTILDTVIQAMKYTTKPGGTAPRADVRGYSECGKSSTSKKNHNGQYIEKAYRCSFIGFSPVHLPAFVLLITMDEPEYGFLPGIGKTHHGGTAAGPVFREIFKRSLEYLGIAPDDPYGYPIGDPRSNPDKADWVIETRRLQEMYKKWNNKTQH